MKGGKYSQPRKEDRKDDKQYYEQLYASRLDILYKIGTFLERRKFPKLTSEETENWKEPIMNKETSSVMIIIIIFPQRKAQDHIASLVRSTKCLKKN